jgi:hypothetical protein
MDFFIECSFLLMLPVFQRVSPKEYYRRIKEIGANRIIMTTDSFFEWTPPPAEMMRMFVATMLDQGITGDEIEMMIRKNPGELLNV